MILLFNFLFSIFIEIKILMSIFLFQFFNPNEEYYFQFLVLTSVKSEKVWNNKDRKAMKTNHNEYKEKCWCTLFLGGGGGGWMNLSSMPSHQWTFCLNSVEALKSRHPRKANIHCDWFSLPSDLCSFQAFSKLPEVRITNQKQIFLVQNKIWNRKIGIQISIPIFYENWHQN